MTVRKPNKKPKKLNFIIPLIIYPFDIMVSFGESDEEVNKRLEGFGISQEDWTHASMNDKIGRAIMFKKGPSLLRMPSIPLTPHEFGTLQHEIFHCVTFVMEKIGINLNLNDSDEAYAYLIGYVSEKIYLKILSYQIGINNKSRKKE